MKNIKNISSAFALTIALATCSTSIAAEEATIEAIGQEVEAKLSLTDTFEQIRADVASAKTANPAMLARIDKLVSQIDAELATKPDNADQLNYLRERVLRLRGEISKSLGYDTELVNQIGGELMPTPMMGDVVPMDGQIISDQPLGCLDGSCGGSISGGGFSGGGGGGFSGGGGGGGIGGGGFGKLAAFGGIAAAIAIGASDDNDPGTPASPSN
ncbi:hypothetical protein [Rubripirellula reticaptiva]|uniref:Uncharacterized protein n=1 Tax=Rubripirellula reticaptiva TaxID=2528013 RepID=A0A5C6EMX8_9BACT|nr:hypothetical protein [Rubripirellula reticaptiva]TWU49714.1 hypothetical protein Poly59_43380 [Rubripirellula reticaptiva]